MNINIVISGIQLMYLFPISTSVLVLGLHGYLQSFIYTFSFIFY